jgi:UDP-N-acetylmuramate-alanine ligase
MAINELGIKASVVQNPEDAINFIKNKIYQDKGGVVLTMGAGDMTTNVSEGWFDKEKNFIKNR